MCRSRAIARGSGSVGVLATLDADAAELSGNADLRRFTIPAAWRRRSASRERHCGFELSPAATAGPQVADLPESTAVPITRRWSPGGPQ